MGATVPDRWLYEFTGDPTNVDIRILNPPKGAIIFDPESGDLRKKVTGFNDNSGYAPITSLALDVANGVPALNDDAELVGPIIVRHDTTAALDILALSAGELAGVTDDPGAIREGDGTTAGGIGFGPPLTVSATATAGNVTAANCSKAVKFPGRTINIVVTAANAAAFSHAINITGITAAQLVGRLVTIRLIITADEATTVRALQVGAQNIVYAADTMNSDHTLGIGGSGAADLGSGAMVVFIAGPVTNASTLAVVLGGYNFAAIDL